MSGYYICGIVGTGGDGDAYRPALADYPVDWSMTQGGQNCLVYVSNPTPELDADPRIVAFKKDLTATYTLEEWGVLTERLSVYGIDLSEYDPERTVREIINAIGREWEPTFDLSNLSVS